MSERSDSMADAIEKHADLILRASGSGLRHYTMQKTRAAILMAVADCFEEAYRAGAEFGREHADTENETLLTAVREMRSVIKQLNYWFDADEEFLAAMSPDELADHNRQVAKISNVLTKYAGIGE